MISRRLLVAVLLLTPAFAQEKPKTIAGPEKWEKEIAAFEAGDKASPPPKGEIVFVGSSTIRLWDLVGAEDDRAFSPYCWRTKLALAHKGLIDEPESRLGRYLARNWERVSLVGDESLVYWLRKLESEKRIPVLPVYLDSPMAAGALQFYRERADELDPELSHGGEGHRQACVFSTERMIVVETVEQSKAIMNARDTAIVIAASGMATGGRVLHHLASALPDKQNTVMFVGYQSAGTRGRLLCDGAKQIKMLGQVVPVAARIERLDSMSAHADADEILRLRRDDPAACHEALLAAAGTSLITCVA